jgi:hypothetical protein
MANDKQLLSNLIVLIQILFICEFTTTHCGQTYVERQFTMVDRKDRKRNAAAHTPQPVPKKSKQLPSEPKMGSKPTILMFASFRDKKNIPVRVILDTGCVTHMMSKQWANSCGFPLVTRMEPKIVENFNAARVEDAG